MLESLDRIRTGRRGRRATARWAAGLTALGCLVAPAAQAVMTGDDLVFAVDGRDGVTGFGEAGLVVGEIDQKDTDVRAGLAKTSEAGTVLFEIQLGEPNKIARKTLKTTVAQKRDLAMRVRITDAGATLDETHAARVAKCRMTVSFSDQTELNQAQNLPDTAKWKLVCDKGWQKAFEELGDEAVAVLKAVLGGSEFKLKGQGVAADRDVALDDLDFPMIDGD
jgi:hypothetical protein